MKLQKPIEEIEKIVNINFRIDQETSKHLNALCNMFPYVASKSVVMRELINSAYDHAVEENLINE